MTINEKSRAEINLMLIVMLVLGHKCVVLYQNFSLFSPQKVPIKM